MEPVQEYLEGDLREKVMKTSHHSVGKRIKQKRIEKKLTQSELSDTICSQAELSKIENGLNSPTVQLLGLIAKRLGTSMTTLLEDYEMTDRFQNIDRQLLSLMREEQYLELLLLIENRFSLESDDEIKLLLRYHQVIAEYRLQRIDFRTASVILLQLANSKDLVYDAPMMYIRIKMAISIFYAENKQFTQAEKIYKELETTDFLSVTMKVQQLKVLYNHAKLVYKIKGFKKGVLICTMGIEQSVQLNHLSYIAHFYYQRAECYEEMYGFDNRTRNDYTMAYELFKALEMKRYVKIVEDTKKQFLKQFHHKPK